MSTPLKSKSSKRARVSHPNKCSSKTLNVLRSLVECTACHRIPVSPIKTCKKGHIVCGPCAESNKACSCTISEQGSTSDIQVLPVLGPSYLAERIVSQYTFTKPCHFENNGCSLELYPNDLIKHLLICQYRPFGCFETREETDENCNGQEFHINSFLSHLQVVHKIKELAEDDMTIVEYRTIDELTQGYNGGIFFIKRFDGQSFLGHTLCRNNTVYFWVSILGNESVAAKYKYEWILKNPKADPSLNPTEGDYSWKISVVPIYTYRFDDALSLGRVASYDCKPLVHLYCTEEVEPKSSIKFKASWRQTIKIYKV